MKSTNYTFLKSILFSLLIISCSVPDLEDNPVEEIIDNSISLSIPNGFDFSTHEEVVVSIKDNSNYAKYDIYIYSSEPVFVGNETYENESGEIVTEPVYRNGVLDQLIFSGVPYNGVLSQTINVPTYSDKIYIRRNENFNYSSSIENIVNQQVDYTFTSAKSARNSRLANKTSQVNANDYLYCVNGSAELFQVAPLTGELTSLSTMPMGSYTAAIDQENKELYSIGRSSPYPLMKYSIENNTWTTVANLGIGGPRLDYNSVDKLLYFSKNDKLYTFDPITGTKLNTWTINGLHNTAGGDLAFAEDGTLFLCTFSGLYRLELDANNEYQSTRISADTLPFMPTSMTFDSNQELWLANNASSSDLIIMDTQTGGWKYQYGINASNNTNIGRTINDLTTFRVYSNIIDDTDTDGDGILDSDDSFPDNAEKAFEVFTPSKYGAGTIAFEDLWPSAGDYDFNDMALNYQAIAILNAQNLAVQVDFICRVKSNNAGYTNGLGIEIEGLSPSLIESVTGTFLTENYVVLNANGTEANQENAVIIFTDDIDNLLNETTISIKFTQPISTNILGVAPFNPFIIVNKNREMEVHLPKANITSLGKNSFNVSGVNKDPDGDFISKNGLPWAISIIHDFKVPKENISIIEAYNYFSEWATSGGTVFKDWYKDNPGYRNSDKIKF
jgi:LruC domain-containing protein